MSRIDQVLANYNNFISNQDLSSTIFDEEQDNEEENETKMNINEQAENMGMMFQHFATEKLKGFLEDKLGDLKDKFNEFIKDPKGTIERAAQEQLNNARTNLEDEINERGLNPQDILNRTRNITRDEIDRIRQGNQDTPDEPEAEGLGPDEEPDAEEPDAPPPPPPQQDTEPMEDDEPDAEPLDTAPVSQTQSIVDSANDVEGFQSAAQTLRNMAEDSVGLPRGALNNASSESIARNLERYGDPERQDLADSFRNLQTKFNSFQQQQSINEPDAEPLNIMDTPIPASAARVPIMRQTGESAATGEFQGGFEQDIFDANDEDSINDVANRVIDASNNKLDQLGVDRSGVNNASDLSQKLESTGDTDALRLSDNLTQIQSKLRYVQNQQNEINNQMQNQKAQVSNDNPGSIEDYDPRPPAGMQQFDVDESQMVSRVPEPEPVAPTPIQAPDIAADSSEFAIGGDAADLLLL
jgi:hypothetical protein